MKKSKTPASKSTLKTTVGSSQSLAALRHQRRIAELSHRLDAKALGACVVALELAARLRGVL